MRLNLSLILAGLLCFFNPCFNLFDMMPNFIGAILVMAGLSRMYMYDGNFEDAKKSAKFLLWISVLRLALCLWATNGHRDYILAFTFIVCVLETIFMISMFKGLYLGLEYTLMRADCEGYIKSVSEAFTMSFVFTISSKLLEFAPNICDIIKQDAELDLSSGASFKMSMAQMKMYVLGACLFLGLAVGIIYFFVTAKTWIKIIADKNYHLFLKGKYDSYIETDKDIFLSENIQKIYLLISTAFVFIFDFYIDGIGIIPSFISVLLLFAAAIYLNKFSTVKNNAVFPISLCALTCCVINYLYMTKVHLGINYLYVFESYYKEEFLLLESTKSVYFSALLSLLEFVFTFLLIFITISQMKRLFKNEKRSVALPMLNLLYILSFFTALFPAVRKVLTTACAHLATNRDVLTYIQNKTYIKSEESYNAFMANELISNYETLSAFSYYAAIISFVFALICILYLMRIRRFTDGTNN